MLYTGSIDYEAYGFAAHTTECTPQTVDVGRVPPAELPTAKGLRMSDTSPYPQLDWTPDGFAARWAEVPVETAGQARAFFVDAACSIGDGYHPDDHPADLVNYPTRQPTYDEATAEMLEQRTTEAYAVADEDPCEMCLDTIHGVFLTLPYVS